MSSENDTDPERTTDDKSRHAPASPGRGAGPPEPTALRSVDYTEYAKYTVPILIVAIAAVAGYFQGPASTLLVLAGGALVAVIATFWASVRTLVGETPLTGADAYAIGAPRVEEEQKRAVLRALKDLEFERSVGKISEADYQVLTTKYRAEAKRLLRLLDAESHPRRAQVEALVAERLVRAGLAAPGPALYAGWGAAGPNAEPAGGGAETGAVKTETDGTPRRRRKEQRAANAKKSAPTDDAPVMPTTAVPVNPPEPAAKPTTSRICASCSTVNDEDAMFCKRCGARQGAVVGAQSPPEDAKEAPHESAEEDDAARAEEDDAARAEKEPA